MDEKRKAISADDRLRALALFTMAKEHAMKAREYELALQRILLVEDGGNLGDLIWGFETDHSTQAFDQALTWEGIAVAEEGT